MTSLLSSHMACSLTTRRLSALMRSSLHRAFSDPARHTDYHLAHVIRPHGTLPVRQTLVHCAFDLQLLRMCIMATGGWCSADKVRTRLQKVTEVLIQLSLLAGNCWQRTEQQLERLGLQEEGPHMLAQ